MAVPGEASPNSEQSTEASVTSTHLTPSTNLTPAQTAAVIKALNRHLGDAADNLDKIDEQRFLNKDDAAVPRLNREWYAAQTKLLHLQSSLNAFICKTEEDEVMNMSVAEFIKKNPSKEKIDKDRKDEESAMETRMQEMEREKGVLEAKLKKVSDERETLLTVFEMEQMENGGNYGSVLVQRRALGLAVDTLDPGKFGEHVCGSENCMGHPGLFDEGADSGSDGKTLQGDEFAVDSGWEDEREWEDWETYVATKNEHICPPESLKKMYGYLQ